MGDSDNRLECCGKISKLLADLREQRYGLELALEVAPRNSRYSNGLVSMMQREEALLREGKQCKEISKEVEAALNHETKAFFAKMSASNKKRWHFLLHKSQREKEELLDMVRDKCVQDFTGDDHILDDDFAMDSGRLSARGRSNKFTAGSDEVTILDIEIESLRLEEDYNKNWLEIEGFHIEEAFKSQKERIDSEWAVHFDRLNSQYETKRRQIIGQHTKTTESDKSSYRSSESRWQHPEKQKTLIHTAPVFSPSVGSSKKMAVGSGVRAVRTKGSTSAKEQMELDRLEKQHAHMMGSLHSQKANAVRWMRHQETRLTAQNEGIHTSRIPIANILSLERSLLKHFRTLFRKEELRLGKKLN